MATARRKPAPAKTAPETAPVGSTVEVKAGAIVRYPDGTTATTRGFVRLQQAGEYAIDGKTFITATATDDVDDKE